MKNIYEFGITFHCETSREEMAVGELIRNIHTAIGMIHGEEWYEEIIEEFGSEMRIKLLDNQIHSINGELHIMFWLGVIDTPITVLSVDMFKHYFDNEN